MNEIIEQFKVVFNFDDKPLQDGIKKTQSSMQNLGKVFGSVIASIGAFQGIKAITVDYANYNTQLGLNASLIGANVEQLDTLGNALQYFGGNTESAVSSIKSLNGHLEEAKRGQGALIEVSRKYGLSINPYQEPTEALLQMSKQMGRFTTQQRLAISQQLGLDDSITRAFGDPERLAKHIARMKELGASTQEDVKISDEFNDSITYLKQIFNALARDFARVVLPMFTKLVDLFSSFIEWVRKHKQLVIIFFTALAVAMLPVLLLLGKIAIASLVAFAPLILAFAKIAVLSLILEDIYGYFMGWDSVTGDLVKKFPVLGMLLEPIRPIVKAISDTFGSIVDWLKNPTFENFGKIFDNVLNIVKEIIIAISVGIYNALGMIGTAIIDLGKSIIEWFTKPIDGAVESLKGMFSSAKNFLGFGGDTSVTQAPPVPLQSSATTQNQANNYNVNNNFNQNISSATPKAFADQTNSQISNSIMLQRQNQGAL